MYITFLDKSLLLKTFHMIWVFQE